MDSSHRYISWTRRLQQTIVQEVGDTWIVTARNLLEMLSSHCRLRFLTCRALFEIATPEVAASCASFSVEMSSELKDLSDHGTSMKVALRLTASMAPRRAKRARRVKIPRLACTVFNTIKRSAPLNKS